MKTLPDFRKSNENESKAINLCMMYDMQIGAKQTIMKRSPIVDSFLASASPIRASLLTCKITSLSFCRFFLLFDKKKVADDLRRPCLTKTVQIVHLVINSLERDFFTEG